MFGPVFEGRIDDADSAANVSGLNYLQDKVRVAHDFEHSVVVQGGGAAVYVTAYVRLQQHQVFGGDGLGSGNRRSSRMAHHADAHLLGGSYLREAVGRILVPPEPELGKTDTLVRQVAKVLRFQGRFEDHRPAVYLHAVGPVVRPGPLGEYGESDYSVGVVRSSRSVYLSRRDRLGDPPVNVGTQKTDRVLPGGEVAYHHMAMGIDQTRSHRGPVGIDNLVCLPVPARGSDRCYPSVFD